MVSTSGSVSALADCGRPAIVGTEAAKAVRAGTLGEGRPPGAAPASPRPLSAAMRSLSEVYVGSGSSTAEPSPPRTKGELVVGLTGDGRPRRAAASETQRGEPLRACCADAAASPWDVALTTDGGFEPGPEVSAGASPAEGLVESGMGGGVGAKNFSWATPRSSRISLSVAARQAARQEVGPAAPRRPGRRAGRNRPWARCLPRLLPPLPASGPSTTAYSRKRGQGRPISKR
jgi:hypothetical protein